MTYEQIRAIEEAMYFVASAGLEPEQVEAVRAELIRHELTPGIR